MSEGSGYESAGASAEGDQSEGVSMEGSSEVADLEAVVNWRRRDAVSRQWWCVESGWLLQRR